MSAAPSPRASRPKFRPSAPPRGPPQPSDDELELERDMEYFVEPEEALGPRGETIE